MALNSPSRHPSRPTPPRSLGEITQPFANRWAKRFQNHYITTQKHCLPPQLLRRPICTAYFFLIFVGRNRKTWVWPASMATIKCYRAIAYKKKTKHRRAGTAQLSIHTAKYVLVQRSLHCSSARRPCHGCRLLSAGATCDPVHSVLLTLSKVTSRVMGFACTLTPSSRGQPEWSRRLHGVTNVFEPCVR